MEADEQKVEGYLKSLPGQFISGREIARRAGGKEQYRENPDWARPVLRQLMEKHVIETDSMGHYRLFGAKVRGDGQRWISPQMRKILEKSGRKFLQGGPRG